ncbi:hypothetical protein GJ496_005516 [Pomphorhynchus laevis]|nr:hypothetical protein GJ496_005516 [Pomphorhynchus laevis]
MALVIGIVLATVLYLTTAILGISVAVKLQTEDSECNIPLYLYINNRVICGIITLGFVVWLAIEASTNDINNTYIIVLCVVAVSLCLEITSLFLTGSNESRYYETSTKIYSTKQCPKKPPIHCCEPTQMC